MTEKELIEGIFKEIEGGIYQFIENETCHYECKDFLANLKEKCVKEALPELAKEAGYVKLADIIEGKVEVLGSGTILDLRRIKRD